MARICILLAMIIALLGCPPAMADGGFTQLAKENYWVALSHSSSATAPVDACIAGEPALGDFGFYLLTNAAGGAIIKISNESWSLTPNVTGTIKLAVNGNNYALPITSNTADAINAQLTPIQFIMIVGDLEASTSMTLTVANLPTDTEPLDGSKDVLAAFMKCNEGMNPQSNPGG